MSKAIDKDNIMALLPDVLKNNTKTYALCSAVAQVLSDRVSEIDTVKLYGAVATLSETLLDILAKDFKIEWYDANMSLSEKRSTILESWMIHSKIGTVGAVKRAIKAVYDDCEIQEWFQYGGSPYHFKIVVSSGTEPSAEKQASLLREIGFYKNVRSVLDSIDYVSNGAESVGYSYTIPSGENIFDRGDTVES